MTAQAAAATPTYAFVADWEDLHRTHESRRADPHGFLAITEPHWLTGVPQRFPDEPGFWSTGAEGVGVDFNRAANLLCAHTDLAPCPSPPVENRLPPLEAGEQLPYERRRTR
ncbi:DUF1684 domain-containing protein [Nocardia beijingensis]|uniref:DUF1684 domain-containing protein n=1 Tax=Nocardia beijingensis TaxID=95162 RepID=UPI001893202D|nr:DUF1684 domain-containing protein [Nocardia beijingensis]MBF6469671.1 DUF1684 domain-containing protein [Nocardia beijingensis]